jgi:hypothetical protein
MGVIVKGALRCLFLGIASSAARTWCMSIGQKLPADVQAPPYLVAGNGHHVLPKRQPHVGWLRGLNRIGPGPCKHMAARHLHSAPRHPHLAARRCFLGPKIVHLVGAKGSALLNLTIHTFYRRNVVATSLCLNKHHILGIFRFEYNMLFRTI